MTAIYAGLISLGGAIIVALIAWYIAARTVPETPSGQVIPALYRIRFRYFLILLAVLLVALVATIPLAPYVSEKAAPPDLVVDATGHMWYWDITLLKGDMEAAGSGEVVIPEGALVEFRVQAADVNHGFGLYDDAGNLLAQVQAMPGYANRLRYRFDAAGTYQILCLEYCGMAHHAMISNITVE